MAAFPQKGEKVMMGKRIRMDRMMNRETGKTELGADIVGSLRGLWKASGKWVRGVLFLS
jgi:hypothetical protein